MRFTTLINNVKIVEWKLTCSEAHVFAWFYELPSWADKTLIEGKDYFFASRTKAIEELPWITDKVDTMYRYYKALEDKGLVFFRKIDNRDYVMLTEKARTWNEWRSERSEKNPTKLGKKSEKHSEKNPTYNSTIQDNSISNTLPAEPVEEKPKTVYQNFIDIYNGWYLSLSNAPPKFDGVAGNAAKAIITYLKSVVKERAKKKKEDIGADKIDGRILNLWKYILDNWEKIEPFKRGKMMLVDINSKIQDITNEVLNGYTNTKTGKDNSHRAVITGNASGAGKI